MAHQPDLAYLLLPGLMNALNLNMKQKFSYTRQMKVTIFSSNLEEEEGRTRCSIGNIKE
jgi:hypothetical protein